MNPEGNFIPIESLDSEKRSQPLVSFNFEGQEQAVSFIETTHVVDGVICEVYSFVDDDTKDLGIIKISPSKKIPLQKVLKGEKTIEGYISGKGKLTITKPDGKQEEFVADGSPLTAIVNIGELMRWEADPDLDLVAFEICFPPYEDGRFKNIV